MRIYPHGFDFLQPYCDEAGVFVSDPGEAECILTMNQCGHDALEKVGASRDLARQHGLPLAYWTVEDPNSYAYTIHQAKLADYVFTSDGALIEQYRRDLGHRRVWWLPLAASEKYHRPLPLAEGATDLVFSGNFYPNEARRWGDETVLLPLVRAGYSCTIFCYAVNPDMPEELRPYVRGDGGGCRNVAEQYRHGKIVIGNNNQRSGFDGRERTLMCSMRAFEALACGKPFLSPWSEAYEALGITSLMMCVSDSPEKTLIFASLQPNSAGFWGPGITQDYGDRGRAFVLAHHTYRHRMERIARAIAGEADPEGWR